MTFSGKLDAISRDLESIVTRMNRDKSYDRAQKAQAAILAVDELRDPWFDDLNWKWKPSKEQAMNLRSRVHHSILSGHTTVAEIAKHLHEPENRVCGSVMGLKRIGLVRRTTESANRRTAVYEPITGPAVPPRRTERRV